MKTIIISDLHNRFEWVEYALSSPLLQPHDNVVFLGDYFDDFYDTPEIATNVAKWLKQSLKKPNRVHLMGTHDLWYMFPYNRFIAASGNTESKMHAIRSVLTEQDWNLLKLYHYEQGFLMTHAGVHINLIGEYVFKHNLIDLFDKYITNKEQLNGQEVVDQIVKPATIEAMNRIKDGYAHPWLDAGVVRGGRQPVGGIIWLDWIYEFKPIPGLNQIVGHTELNVPDEKYIKSSRNYNLDTKNQHVGILDNEEFRYIETVDILGAI